LVLDLAPALARAEGWASFSKEYLLLALLDDDRAGAVLTEAGVNVSELRTEIAEAVKVPPPHHAQPDHLV
jgi:ATP-dependent Clp protease ATP-binding subunit ClpA